jgi:hypothetical protein
VLRGELGSIVELELEFARSITEGTTFMLCGELSSEGKKLESSVFRRASASKTIDKEADR